MSVLERLKSRNEGRPDHWCASITQPELKLFLDLASAVIHFCDETDPEGLERFGSALLEANQDALFKALYELRRNK